MVPDYATKEDVKQLAALQMEFKKELDMLKEHMMDLAERVSRSERQWVSYDMIRELQHENSALKSQLNKMGLKGV